MLRRISQPFKATLGPLLVGGERGCRESKCVRRIFPDNSLPRNTSKKSFGINKTALLRVSISHDCARRRCHSLLFRCYWYSDSRESTCNSNLAGELARNSLESLIRSLSAEPMSRILGTIGHFLASCAKNSLQNSLKQGIWKRQDVSQFLTSSLLAAALTSIVFQSIFPH